MIRTFVLAGLLIVSTWGFSQTDYATIDSQSKSVPNSLRDYKAIANHLTQNLESDTEKARAIYIWIAHNIKYDMNLMYAQKQYDPSFNIVDDVLKKRKGVCQHYAELFREMSNTVGLESYMISGYTRNATGKIADLSHAWNGIKIDSAYYMIDATWAAGYQHNGNYIHRFRDNFFLISPQEFIKTHMPFDPIWQFIDTPIDNRDFMAKDFSKLETSGEYAFEDSIQKQKDLNELARLESSNNRIIANGIKNKLIQMQVDQNFLQITTKKYNRAIDTLNYGIDAFNLYITHKNRQFRNPKLDEKQIKHLINDASQAIYAANDMLYGLIASNDDLNKLIKAARKKLPTLMKDIEREKDFVEKYTSKWKPTRGLMFYQ